jgi:hypothetical protein
VANFLLAFLIYWVLFVAGLPGMKPVLGDPPRNTPAAAAGIVNGDIVRSVADEPVFTWTDVRWMLLKEAVKREAGSDRDPVLERLGHFAQPRPLRHQQGRPGPRLPRKAGPALGPLAG